MKSKTLPKIGQKQKNIVIYNLISIFFFHTRSDVLYYASRFKRKKSKYLFNIN